MRDCTWLLNNPNFPNISPNNFVCSSDRTEGEAVRYNCIAWAVGKKDKFWWPLKLGGYHWPNGLKYEETIAAFIDAFATEKYEPCADGSFEEGFEKIALYVNRNDVPKHAARLLSNGVWTSKMGDFEDIEHPTLELVEGPSYGQAKLFFRRKI